MILSLINPTLFQFLAGLLAGCVIAYLAYQAHALNRSGAAAAALLGTIIFGLGGMAWAVLLLAFFISSSALSRAFAGRKTVVDEKYSKGSRRDAGQVLANGGLAGLLVLAYLAVKYWQPELAFVIWLAFTASLAAANADTWATELGVLSPTPPVLITTFKPVERGTSGGVSAAGTLAALAGSALITLLGWLMTLWGLAPQGPAAISAQTGLLYLLVLLAGLDGSLVDSMLGATAQAIYTCPTCQKETERHPYHSCGSPTTLKRGLSWLNNDWVNTACTMNAALVVLVIGGLAQPAWPAGSQTAAQGGPAMSLSLTIPAFTNGGKIPKGITCDGANLSPAISWSGTPSGARSLALIVEDPDAPSGIFNHWVLYNIPPALTTLAAGQPQTASLASGGMQGRNSFRHTYFDGPCPPAGKPHRYYFRLYALDIDPLLAAGLDGAQLKKAMQGHILAQGEWMGTYGR
jgi:Raf kinase inhibitor-like YbhB/YbcL family protein/uncharacterized protein (TIGR00297 family)